MYGNEQLDHTLTLCYHANQYEFVLCSISYLIRMALLAPQGAEDWGRTLRL
jgi:hypothetical protein